MFKHPLLNEIYERLQLLDDQFTKLIPSDDSVDKPNVRSLVGHEFGISDNAQHRGELYIWLPVFNSSIKTVWFDSYEGTKRVGTYQNREVWYGSSDTKIVTIELSNGVKYEAIVRENVADKNGTLNFHHYNPAAWKGMGSALVLCSGVRADSCYIDGSKAQKHSALDKGREVWTLYTTPGVAGTITVKIDGKTFTAKVKGSGLQFGNC